MLKMDTYMNLKFIILALMSHVIMASEKPTAPKALRIGEKPLTARRDHDKQIWTDNPFESVKNCCCNLDDLFIPPFKTAFNDICLQPCGQLVKSLSSYFAQKKVELPKDKKKKE